MSEVTEKILVIINPNAGKYGATQKAEQLCKALKASGAFVQSRATEGIGHARDIVSQEASHYDLVVACGGDGTLSEVVSGLMRLDTPPDVGFLPVGSTCDIARNFRLPSHPQKAAHVLLKGIAYPLDIGRVTGSVPELRDDLPEGVVPDETELLPDHFSYVTSFGAFSETSYATKRELKKSLGHFAYVLTGLQSVPHIHPVETKVTLDGDDYSGAYIFGGVLNSYSVGGMVKIDQVSFNDGLFEVLLVKPPKNMGQIARLLSLLLRRKTGDAIIRRRAREVVFEFPDKVSFTIDGEYGGSRHLWRIENIERAIRLRVAEPPQNTILP
jgi:YegS/Rv2252/BmrU family lipid kinase